MTTGSASIPEWAWVDLRQVAGRAPFAICGRPAPDLLWEAYRRGAFPWTERKEGLEWWCPDPRCVLRLDRLRISDSLRRERRRAGWRFTCDTAFAAVVDACATTPRRGQDGTWITPGLRDAILGLHAQGRAHSIEAWWEGELAGGLYGLARGGVFFGESMFHRRRDASKLALWHLVDVMRARGMDFVDCQVPTPHLVRMGADVVARAVFLNWLAASVQRPLPEGTWAEDKFS